MSITSDIRAYADSAIDQGKQVLDTAQAQLNDYTGAVGSNANELVGKTRDNITDIADKTAQVVADVRQSAEKAVNLDALSAAIEPYLAQLREYTSAVTDRVDDLLASARGDRRVAALADRVEPVVGAVVGLASERVVKPVQSFTGLGAKPDQPANQPAAKPGPKPTPNPPTVARAPRRAVAKPAGKPVTKPVNKPTARKTAAKRPTG